MGVACNADADAQFTAFTAFGGHASHAVHAAPVAHHAAVHAAPVAHHAVHHAAPVAHHAVHHAVAHHAVVHQGYEQPKHNCSVLDVVEIADVCTPALDTVCTPIELSRKSIKDVEQCYTVTRTVCTESTEEIDNEVCTYSYQPKTEATTAKTVEVLQEGVRQHDGHCLPAQRRIWLPRLRPQLLQGGCPGDLLQRARPHCC